MRLPSLALLLLILAGAAVGVVAYRSATEESRAWDALLALDGKELQLETREPYDLFDRFAFGGGDLADLGFHPWRVLRLDRETTAERVVLLRLKAVGKIPGRDTLRAYVLDPNRRLLSSCEFGSPWRSAFDRVTTASRPEDPRSHLRIQPEDRTGPPTGEILYGLVDDGVELLRLEDREGSLRRNPCRYPNHRSDPLRRQQPLEFWRLRLTSPSSFTVLSALTYLGGLHFTLSEGPEPGVAAESAEEIRSVAQTRADPLVRTRILELRKSPDPWIREAAEAVPLDGSP